MNDAQLVQLTELIGTIYNVHSELTKSWRIYANQANIQIFNQKSVKVKHLMEKPLLMESVSAYVEYLKGRTELSLFNKESDGYEVMCRIKNHNSIEEKIEDYCMYRQEKGEVSVNKCLNDLFGIRIVIDCGTISTDEIEIAIGDLADTLYVEDKNVPERGTVPPYIAKHIYFKSGNEDYRWELQIWRSADQKNNHESHKTHRYKYRRWESGDKSRV